MRKALLFAVWASTLPCIPAQLPEDRRAGAETVTAERLQPWLEYLAGPECAGRGTGTEGFRRAATFVRDRFEELGLEPAGDDNTYWQAVPWVRSAADPQASFLEFRASGQNVRVTPGEGLHGYAASKAKKSGGAVLVVARREHDIDAIAARDLRGKIVLLRADAQPYRKLEIRLRSAAAVITVDDLACELAPSIDGHTRPGPAAANRAIRGRDLRPNALFTNTDTAERVLALANVDLEAAEERGGVFRLEGVMGELSISISNQQAPAYNVAAVLRGSDPELADEFVVVGSHLDHLGTDNGRVHPGADDDASGTVGVLALAHALVHNDVAPRRSVLFVTFCGEEKGLIGSKHFVDHCPIPLESIVAELQVDMIGRSEENAGERAAQNRNSLHLIGTNKLSAELHELCLARNEIAGFQLEWDEEDVFFRSDHYNFAAAGVPIAFFFTGFHRDYHRPTDTADRIEYDKLTRVVRYVYDVAFELAQADGRPRVDPKRWRALRRKLRGAPPARPAAPLRKSR